MKINQMTGDNQNKPDYQKQFQFLMDYVKEKTMNWKNIKDELISKILLKIEVQSKEEFYVYLSVNHDFEENYTKNGYFLSIKGNMEYCRGCDSIGSRRCRIYFLDVGYCFDWRCKCVCGIDACSDL